MVQNKFEEIDLNLILKTKKIYKSLLKTENSFEKVKDPILFHLKEILSKHLDSLYFEDLKHNIPTQLFPLGYIVKNNKINLIYLLNET